MVAFNVLAASFTLFLASLQVAAQSIKAGSWASTDCRDACTIALNSQHYCIESESPDQRLSCVCTDKNGEALATCWSCVIAMKGDPFTVQDAQNNVNEFVNECKAAGKNVNAYTVSAGKTNGNGALASGFVDVAAAVVAGMGVIYALL